MDKQELSPFKHLNDLMKEDAEEFNKRMISLYTQTQISSNGFLNAINSTPPYHVGSTSNQFSWGPTAGPIIMDVVDETLSEFYEKPQPIDFTNDREIIL